MPKVNWSRLSLSFVLMAFLVLGYGGLCGSDKNPNTGSSAALAKSISGQVYKQTSDDNIIPVGDADITIEWSDSVQAGIISKAVNHSVSGKTKSDGSYDVPGIPENAAITVTITSSETIQSVEVITSTFGTDANSSAILRNKPKKVGRINKLQDNNLNTFDDPALPRCQISVPANAVTNDIDNILLIPTHRGENLPRIPDGYVFLAGADIKTPAAVSFAPGKEATPYIILPSQMRAEELSTADIRLMEFINNQWVITTPAGKGKVFTTGPWAGHIGPDDVAPAKLKGVRPWCWVKTQPNAATISGFVRDTAGNPIRGAFVFGGGIMDNSRPDGSYTLRNVAVIKADTLLPVNVTAVGYKMSNQFVKVSPGATVNGVNFVMESESVTQLGGIYGQVVNTSTSAGIYGAIVTLQTSPSIRGMKYDNKTTTSDLTDDTFYVIPPSGVAITQYKWMLVLPSGARFTSDLENGPSIVLNQLATEATNAGQSLVIGAYKVELEVTYTGGKKALVSGGFLLRQIGLVLYIADIRLPVSLDDQLTLKAMSDSTGNYRFVSLPIGEAFIASAKADGFIGSNAIGISALTAGQQKQQDFSLATMASDLEPPSQPGSFTGTAQSAYSIQLTWNASSDNVGIDYYRVYRGGIEIGKTTATSYIDSGLAAGTSYIYIIGAFDKANNSVLSSSTSITTQGIIVDGIAPSTPTNLAGVSFSPSQINLSWLASSDNIGVSGYNIYRSSDGVTYTAICSLQGTSYSNFGLSAATTYWYKVCAYDAIGNISPSSDIISVTTQAILDTAAPSIPTGLAASAFSSGQINLFWNTSTDTGGSGLTGYKIFRSVDGISYTFLTNLSSVLSYSNSGLSASTTYWYKVAAYDGAGNTSAQSSAVSATTHSFIDTIAPSIPTNLGTSVVTSNSIGLTWSASNDNVSIYRYKVYRNGVCIALVIATNFFDTGLTPSTAYAYTVTACDETGNASANSLTLNVSTLADTAAPSAPTGLSATAMSASRINLTWAGSTDNVGVVGYKIYRNSSLCATLAVVLSYSDSGLAGSTIYNYTVRAYDAANNISLDSNVVSATTPAGVDTQAPSIPAGLAANPASCTQINVSWTVATDNVGVAGYNIYRGGVFIYSTSLTYYNNTGLAPSTAYGYAVAAYDAAYNVSGICSVVTGTTSADTTQPSVPSGLSATAIASSQVNLTWAGSTDNVGVVGYKIYRNSSLCATVTAILLYSDTGLSGSTTYNYTIRAYDAANNISADSITATATTPVAVDTQAPSIPAGLAANPSSCTQINVSWTAATDNVGVAGYNIYRGGVFVYSTSFTYYNNTGLMPNTAYGYAIAAYDGAGNISAQCGVVTGTTLADTSAPSAPTNLSATAVTSSQINLSWTGSTDNIAVTGYKVYRNGSLCANLSTGLYYSDTGLEGSTLYTYYLLAYDAAGNNSTASITATATTLAAVDTQTPSTPTTLVVSSPTCTSLRLDFGGSTDNVAVTGYKIYRNSVYISSAITTYDNTGLTPNTAYGYTVAAYDAVGNISVQCGAVTGTTLADTSAPSIPVGLTGTAVSTSQINLYWNASTDNVGVSGYMVYRNGTQISTVNNTNYADTGLSSGASYSYAVVSFDLANNISLQCSPITVTTQSFGNALVAHWKFNENCGTTVGDSSGYGNNGTVYGPTWSGDALSFDGVNDYVSFNYASLLNGGDFSLQCWFKTSASGIYQGLFFKNDTHPPYKWLALRITQANALQFNCWDGYSEFILTDNLSVTDGKWHCATMVRNSNTAILYLDGAKRTQGTLSLNLNDIAGTVFIGVENCIDFNSRYFFNGQIDEGKIYNYARTSEQVQADYNAVICQWTQKIAQGAGGSPSARYGHDMVWDGTRVIMFGGEDGTSFKNDLWWYNPVSNTWTQKIAHGAPGSPAQRYYQTMVWDGTRVIMFGGWSAMNKNDVWWYDPNTNTWTQKIAHGAPGSPAGRYMHSMIWDGTNVILFGGWNASVYYNDVWWYNPGTNTWTQKIAHGTPGSPVGRYMPTFVWNGSKCVMFGGYDSSADRNDLWSYDPSLNTWTEKITNGAPGSPQKRVAPSAIWDNNQMFIFGGRDTGPVDMNDLWAYNHTTNAWTKCISADTPSNRFVHKAVWDGAKGIMFGGFATTGSRNDLWWLNTRKPVAHWKFDEGAGVIANDVSGNGNHGVVNGATWSGGALSFDGVDDYVSIPDSSTLDLSNQVTIELWGRSNINWDLYNNYTGLISKGTDTSNMNYCMLIPYFYSTYGLYFEIETPTNNDAHSPTTLVKDTWYHIVGTYDGVNIKMYLNGVLVDEQPDTGLMTTNNYPVYIGLWRTAYNEFFNGQIDDVKIYNYARSAGDIQAEYNAATLAVDDYVWVANQNSNSVTRIKKSDSNTTTIAVGSNPVGVAVDSNYAWIINNASNNVTRIKKSDSTTTTIAVGTNPNGVTVDETYCWVANLGSNNVTRIKKSDLTTTTIAVGTNPIGVAVDGTYCWVANAYNGSGGNNVTRIKKSDLTTTTISVGTCPFGVAVDETYCWVANSASNNVTRILKSDLTTTTISVGSSPQGVTVDGTYCWVANYGSNNVTLIKKSDLTTSAITVGIGPRGVAVDATYCWVANDSSNNVTCIKKFDSSTTTIAVGTNPYSLGDMTGYAYDNYANLAVTAVDDYVWVTSLPTNNVTRIKKSNSTTATIAVGTTTGSIATDPKYVWMENTTSNNITRINKSDLTTITIAVGTDPCGIAVDEIYCWVANYGSNNVTRIKKSDLTTTTISVGTNPTGMAVDGTYVWVSNQGSNNVTRIRKSDLTTITIAAGATPSGIAVDATYCWVANQGATTVTRIKKSDSSTTTITVGSQPVGVSADETYCWVANAGSANVTRITKSDSSTTNISVGNHPNGISVDDTYCWVANEGAGSGNTVTRIKKSDSTTTAITVGNQPSSVGDMTGYAYDNYSTQIIWQLNTPFDPSTQDTILATVNGKQHGEDQAQATEVFNNRIFYYVYTDGSASPSKVYCYNPANGTNSVILSETSDSFRAIRAMKGNLYISHSNGKLWKYDGTTVAEIATGIPLTTSITAMCEFNNKMYFGTQQGGYIYESTDGTFFTLRATFSGRPSVPMTSNDTITDLKVWNGYLYACNYECYYYSAKIVRSADGVTWSVMGTFNTYGFNGFVTTPNYLYVASVEDASGPSLAIRSSTDGVTWNRFFYTTSEGKSAYGRACYFTQTGRAYFLSGWNYSALFPCYNGSIESRITLSHGFSSLIELNGRLYGIGAQNASSPGSSPTVISILGNYSQQ
ncbi:MAG: LamG-like jellyroll fold domain-containing protein [Candidatus Brocadiia bacterium]